MQDEVAKRHCFACILYIAKGIIEGSRGHDAQQKRSTASLSKVLSAFDVGYGLPDCPYQARNSPHLKASIVTCPDERCC